VQHVDATARKKSGLSAWLWVLTDAHATRYRIHPNSAHEWILVALREDLVGMPVSDCFLVRFSPAWLTANLFQRAGVIRPCIAGCCRC
jgi:hypothetical protein